MQKNAAVLLITVFCEKVEQRLNFYKRAPITAIILRRKEL